MAQDTKVALVAGLGFVVCFTVVLTNRGASPRIAAPMSLPSSTDVDRPADTDPRETQRRFPSAQQRPGEFNVEATDHRRSSLSLAGMTSAPASGPANSGTLYGAAGDFSLSLVDEAPTKRARRGDHRRGQDIGSKQNALTHASTIAPRDSDKRDPSPRGSEQRRRELEGLLNQVIPPPAGYPAVGDYPVDGIATDADGSRPGPTSPGSLPQGLPVNSYVEPDPPTMRYVVGHGDTLYGIATKAYGVKSVRVVTAIYHANTSVLKSPDALRIGQELVLPHIPGLEAPRWLASVASPPVTADEGSSSHDATDRNTGQTRWYQVKKNDRYVSIARRELGDASRWREIYEINKGSFPEPDKIRDGVRIRLPALALAHVAE